MTADQAEFTELPSLTESAIARDAIQSVGACPNRRVNARVAVGFGREAGADLGRVGLAGVVEGGITRAAAPLALGVGAGGEVFFNDLAQEV